MSQLSIYQAPIITPRPRTLKFSEMVEGMMFKFKNGQRYYTFEGRGYKKFWYVNAAEQEFSSAFDCTVYIVSP